MEPWQLRVFEERTALDARRIEIESFISSSVFQSITEKEQNLLVAQSHAMMAYSHVLTKRIGTFND